MAYSINASDMAELEPKASRSFVNGISSFFATAFTFSLLMSAGSGLLAVYCYLLIMISPAF